MIDIYHSGLKCVINWPCGNLQCSSCSLTSIDRNIRAHTIAGVRFVGPIVLDHMLRGPMYVSSNIQVSLTRSANRPHPGKPSIRSLANCGKLPETDSDGSAQNWTLLRQTAMLILTRSQTQYILKSLDSTWVSCASFNLIDLMGHGAQEYFQVSILKD